MELFTQVLGHIAFGYGNLVGYDGHPARLLWLRLVLCRMALALGSFPGSCSRCQPLQGMRSSQSTCCNHQRQVSSQDVAAASPQALELVQDIFGPLMVSDVMCQNTCMWHPGTRLSSILVRPWVHVWHLTGQVLDKAQWLGTSLTSVYIVERLMMAQMKHRQYA